MKYKVGDKVLIKSLDWYNENKSKSHGTVVCCGKYFEFGMKEWCGEIMTILEVDKTCYIMKEDGVRYLWTDEMIEGLVEEETKPEPKFKVGDSVEVLKSGNVYTISQMKFNGKEFVYTLSNNGSTVSCFSEEEIEFTEEDKYWCDIMSESDPTTYVLPQGYQFVDENGNVINATKIVLEKKKQEYPKTYEECLNVLGYEDIATHCIFHNEADEKLFNTLYDLKVCRDAYWKFYGEEMGLGKPWKPDLIHGLAYTIQNNRNEIGKSYSAYGNKVFMFPTEEMRDVFYENFKELIDECKELL